MKSLIGDPITWYMMNPTTSDEITGMTRIGITGRRYGGSLIFFNPSTTRPGDETGDDATEEAGADRIGDVPAHEPGDQARDGPQCR